MNSPFKKLFKKLVSVSLIGALSLLILLGGIYLYIAPRLPGIEALKEVQLQVPLRVYGKGGELIAEFGEMKRSPLNYNQFPPNLVNAVLSAEDDRFFEHPGVDYQGILRAVAHLIKTGKKGQGGSTITMQVARNFFLSREKTYLRKLNEIFLAFKIEGFLTKKEILALYLNKIYLGKRAYGFAAAAQVYYGKDLHQLSIAEFAMVAGLPKAPSSYNPINNPERALLRRNYVLRRMLFLKFIDEEAYQAALAATDVAKVHGQDIQLEAPYIAEMVRNEMVERYGKAAYTGGYNVYTTVDAKRQRSANKALRNALLGYDRRHGYRGHIGFIDLKMDEKALEVEQELLEEELKILAEMEDEIEEETEIEAEVEVEIELKEAAVISEETNGELVDALEGEELLAEVEVVEPDEYEIWQQELSQFSKYGDLIPALVIQVNEKEAFAYTAENKIVHLPWSHIKWARTYVDDNSVEAKLTSAHERLREGDVIYTIPSKKPGCSWLAQKPTVGGALVALDPEDGAVEALNGGYDYYSGSKFNRATQALRQPGSSFKPFVFSAALDKGYTGATIIADAHVVFESSGLEGTWRPENYGGKIYGDTRLRLALIKSINLVSIRLLRDIGIGYATRYAKRFGFTDKMLPRNLSLVLGSGSLTPYDLSQGYAVFANGGYRVEPYFIDHVTDAKNNVVFLAQPKQVCHPCREAIRRKQEKQAVVEKQKLLEQENLAEITAQIQGDIEPLSVEDPEQLKQAQLNQIKKEDVVEEEISLPPDLSESFLALLDEKERTQVKQGPLQLNLAEQVLSPQTAFIINSMMRDVIKLGTGRGARVIGRKDLAGKTGTTNDQRDAWFTGYNPDLATIAWVGFDTPRPLGDKETGARAALPMWVNFMRDSLRGVKEKDLEQPAGIVSVRIDPETGKLANSTTKNAIFEYFLADQVPTEQSDDAVQAPVGTKAVTAPSDITEDIF